MKRIRVNYVVMNKNPNGIEYDRNIEYFPLEIGTYQLEKHPEISIKITKFDREQFWFIFNNNRRLFDRINFDEINNRKWERISNY